MRRAFLFSFAPVIFITIASSVYAQTSATSDQAPPSIPTSDSYAVSLAQQSIATLTGGISIGDVTLNATVNSAGSSDSPTGTAVLRARGTGESRVDLNFGNETRSDIRAVNNGVPTGSWAVNGGVATAYALHNCGTDAAWFFPALSSLAQTGNPNFIFKYVGRKQHNGVNAMQISVFQVSLGGAVVPSQLSAMDFYLDSATLIPIAVAFNVHPDKNSGQNLSVEVDFLSYQSVQGVQVPMHVQKYQQGALVLDASISTVAVNQGLDHSIFEIN